MVENWFLYKISDGQRNSILRLSKHLNFCRKKALGKRNQYSGVKVYSILLNLLIIYTYLNSIFGDSVLQNMHWLKIPKLLLIRLKVPNRVGIRHFSVSATISYSLRTFRKYIHSSYKFNLIIVMLWPIYISVVHPNFKFTAINFFKFIST